MLRYNKQIEKKKTYYLPLIDFNDRGKLECKFYLPLTFYKEYSPLLKKVNYYIKEFNIIDITKYFNIEKLNNYEKACSNTILYEEILETLDETLYFYNKIDFNNDDIYYLLEFLKKILILLTNIYPHKEEYGVDLRKCQNALEYIDDIKTIKYNNKATKYKKVYLPDSWYILPNGMLYNTGNGHCETSLNIDFYNIDKKNNFEELANYYLNMAKRIKKLGFSNAEFKIILNYSYGVNNISLCREPYISNHIISVLYAKYYFYKFFRELQISSKNLKTDIEKIKSMVNNDKREFFIKCCGFNKVESVVDNTITTSYINYEDIFKEYIDKGWNIYFVPPIIINNNTVEEYNEDFLIIRKILKKG